MTLFIGRLRWTDLRIVGVMIDKEDHAIYVGIGFGWGLKFQLVQP